MRMQERYKLIFNWEGIRYEGNVAYFKSAAFTGPVLTNTTRILSNDNINLDFTEQNYNNSIFLSNYYYIAKLSWGEVVYKPWGVELLDCRVEHFKTGSLKELKDGMKFFIDCSKHEQHVHHKHLVYTAWVTNEHGEELT